MVHNHTITNDSFNISHEHNDKHFCIGHINIRSLLPSFNHFKDMIKDYNFKILGITETWLQEDISNDVISITGYNLVRRDRQFRGGGVALYIGTNLKYKIIDVTTTNVESLWVTIKAGKLKIAVGVLYRPPHVPYAEIEQLFDILGEINCEHDAIILLGDLNIDLLVQNTATQLLNNIFESFMLKQTIRQPTRVTTTSSSLIDVIAISQNLKIFGTSVDDTSNVSDHLLTTTTVFIDNPVTKSKQIIFRNFKNFIYEEFIITAAEADWSSIIQTPQLDSKINAFNRIVGYIFDKHAPLVTVTNNSRKQKPFFTDTLKILRKLKIKALRRYQKTKFESHKAYYLQIRNYFVHAFKAEQKSYYEYVFSRNMSNSKQLWATLKKAGVTNNHDHPISPSVGDASYLNEHFKSQIPATQISEQLIHNYLKAEPPGNFNTFKTMDEQDFYRIFNNIKSNATGADNISKKMLQLLFPIGLDAFLNIINTSLRNGQFPNIWKQSIIMPIPKTTDVKSANDLRPISILPVLSKIIEKHVHNQVLEYLNHHSILPIYQSGFRKNHSTQTALLKVTNDICHYWDDRALTFLALLDYSKAFDTLNHELMVTILYSVGIRDAVLSWFSNYLEGRKQAVRLNGATSEFVCVETGVPQGSILGPLMFIIYVKSVSQSLKFMQYHQYADDLQLYLHFSANNLSEAVRKVSTDLAEVYKWSSEHGLQLNGQKSKLLIIGSPYFLNNVNISDVTIKINYMPLQIVKQARNLGIIMDSDLSFKDQVSSKLRSAFCTIKSLHQFKNILPTAVKLKLTETLIISSVSYGLCVYGHFLTSALMTRLQYVQNCCVRYSLNLNRREHITPHLKNLGMLNIRHYCIYLCGVLLFKILKLETPLYLWSLFTFQFTVNKFKTRNSDDLVIPLHRTQKYKCSFKYVAAVTYNKYKHLFRDCKSIITFKKRFKQELLKR